MNRIEKDIITYQNKIKEYNTFIDTISSNTKALEKFAREEYHMKCDDEDIYIIKVDKDKK